ncbi:hypothetical protein C9374_007987 [Naegleria lovaniensis]|uniref:Rhodanese domain-containing protein n=1 Tax=Naegleria lovaniensis TaxID=51637 RepID=A0AA88KLF6_NAELO|nr:uncharacterized protein C9374_007987 [Naegleria lovaniensis]KAG2378839.1 hypothetical protein C9374_007987 [Naegleria lovaniensis]
MKVDFIEPEDLRYRIELNDQNFHIIDLRDYDYGVGYIRTPTPEQYHHITTEEFTAEVAKQLISENISNQLPNNSKIDFIFHCFYSQQRGPTAAMKMLSIVENLDDSSVESRIGIKVLRGGWGLWNTRFFNDDKVIIRLPDSEEESTSSEDDDE